jgi:AraC-like DNA-binding protein
MQNPQRSLWVPLRVVRSEEPSRGEAMAAQWDLPDGGDYEAPYARHALPASLVRALGWLEGRLDEPIELAPLAAAAGVRPRTLEAHFKLYLGTTPLGWVRRTRLARARQQLLAAGEDANVTAVAGANGFSQLGRFAAQYRRQFGELPSQTLSAARGKLSGRDDERVDEALRLSWGALTSAFTVGPRAWCWAQRAAHSFGETPHLDRARALSLADEAARLAPRDALVLSLCSGALTLSRRLGDAGRLIERSLAIDPWSPWGWVRRGWLSAYAGDDDGALRELQITLRLMPFEPLRHLAFIGIGCAHFNAGRYERAARWIEDGVAAVPESFWAERVLVAAAAQAGARSEARRYARKLLRKDASLTVAGAREAWPFTAAFAERLGDGLAMADIPRA